MMQEMKDALKEIMKEAKENGTFDAVVDFLLESVDEYVDTDEERDKLARAINKHIDIPFLGEKAEYNIFKGGLSFLHEKLDRDGKKPQGL